MPLAVITGAARGIGAAIVDRLAADGWDLVLVDVCADDPDVGYPLADRSELDAVADRTGGRAISADVRSLDDLRSALDGLLGPVAAVDAAIAAAGVLTAAGPLWEVPERELRTVIDVNLVGVANLASACVPRMVDAGGRFVAIGSATAGKATPRLAAYAAAKAGVVSLVRGLAADLAGTGVTANVVEPGTTDTALVAPSMAVYDLESVDGLVAGQIEQRVLDPAEIAAGVAFLCSAEAAAITGAVLPVDAGFSAR